MNLTVDVDLVPSKHMKRAYEPTLHFSVTVQLDFS